MSDQSDDDWDTGNDCSVCGDAPVVNIPGGSGAYWLCGGCVADSLDEKQVSVDFWKGAAARDIEQKKRIQSRLDASKGFGDEIERLRAALKYVILEVSRERERQLAEEGWTPEHDDEHELGEMALAAACYAKQSTENYDDITEIYEPDVWPWDNNWWKPKNQRRDLIRAAALIVAEIERLDRQRLRAQRGSDE